MDLESLPGVGPQLATRIRQTFRNEAAFFDAADRMDLQAIGRVEGISERRAVDLVLAARGADAKDSFFGTTAARRVHDRIMQRLLRYASTDTGRNRLRLLHPLPSKDAADAHIAQVLAAKEQAASTDPQLVRRNLRAIQTPRSPQPTLDTGLLVVAETDGAYDRLHGLGVQHWATLGTPRDLAEAEAYDVVVLAYDEGSLDGAQLANCIEVPAEADLNEFCPHATLATANQDRPAIEACAALAEAFERPTRAPDLLEAMGAIDQRPVDAKSIHQAIGEVKAELDGILESTVADLQLSGPELLRAMAQGRLPAALQSATDDVLRTGRNLLRERTGHALQPYTAGLPLGIDDDEVDRIITDLQAGADLERFRAAQAAAKVIARQLPEVHDEMRAWLEFDATYALGRFAHEHGLNAPQWSNEIAFDASIHLDLAHSPRAQRIAYRLGGDENVTVLTGANSGGKSTLLEHLAQLTIMPRLGLPVVGNHVQVPWLDEVHLVTARRGMDAGAFETFLRGFLPVTQGSAKRLVLADEVESVTELEAAGRIIAFVLDRLAERDSLAVVVTHLAPQVISHVKTAKIRIDGIEATGLDDQHRLVVDRCPKMGRAARSTPELIVQRLAATTSGSEGQLYADLLQTFPGHHA